ncbi:MAG: hypothetical protein RSD47_10190 [Romboutsia sp.]
MIAIVVVAYLSIIVFGFFFYKLDYRRIRLFKRVQIKINTLSEKKKHKLKKTTNILIFIIMFILPLFNDNDIVAGLIIGLLFSIQDVCFSKNVIEEALIEWRKN